MATPLAYGPRVIRQVVHDSGVPVAQFLGAIDISLQYPLLRTHLACSDGVLTMISGAVIDQYLPPVVRCLHTHSGTLSRSGVVAVGSSPRTRPQDIPPRPAAHSLLHCEDRSTGPHLADSGLRLVACCWHWRSPVLIFVVQVLAESPFLPPWPYMWELEFTSDLSGIRLRRSLGSFHLCRSFFHRRSGIHPARRPWSRTS